jgi:hypothetical protein
MSDPRYTDPQYDPLRVREDTERARKLGQIESTNAMWGWIAGGVIVVLLLLFIFGRSPDTSNTAQNGPIPPAATTGAAPPPNPAPPSSARAPAPAPTTTGQGQGQGSAQ